MSPPRETIDLLNWIPSLIATGVLSIVWFDIRRERKRVWDSMRDRNGEPKFVTKTDCSERATYCQGSICKKIEEIKAIQRQSEQKRDSARESDDLRLRAIENSLARIAVVQKIVLEKHGVLKEIDIDFGEI